MNSLPENTVANINELPLLGLQTLSSALLCWLLFEPIWCNWKQVFRLAIPRVLQIDKGKNIYQKYLSHRCHYIFVMRAQAGKKFVEINIIFCFASSPRIQEMQKSTCNFAIESLNFPWIDCYSEDTSMYLEISFEGLLFAWIYRTDVSSVMGQRIIMWDKEDTNGLIRRGDWFSRLADKEARHYHDKKGKERGVRDL